MSLHYILIISGTDLIKYPGISAAGASQEMLKYTACLDAEFIYYGHLKTLDKLPVSPAGIVSPALIAKACLNKLSAKITIIDAGAHIKPQCPYISLRQNPGADISESDAMTYQEAMALFEKSQTIDLDSSDEIILAECVVGGTTTTYSLLRALGYSCQGMVSSSFPKGNHDLKENLVNKALSRFNKEIDPIKIAARLGDPMQIVASALLQKAIKEDILIRLAGGTQMIAVKALIDRLESNNSIPIAVSPWVYYDKSARFKKLLDLVSPKTKILCQRDLSNLDLDEEIKTLSKESCAKELSLKEILENYSQGHVKEGLGMGALIHLTHSPADQPTHI